jgi:hypothetical protein
MTPHVRGADYVRKRRRYSTHARGIASNPRERSARGALSYQGSLSIPSPTDTTFPATVTPSIVPRSELTSTEIKLGR